MARTFSTLALAVLTVAACVRPAAAQDGFSLMIASDTQFTWWRGGKDPDCHGKCVDTKGVETNRNMLSSMNNIMRLGRWPDSPLLTAGAGSPIIKPSGVIINGDLTSFWHGSQAALYKQYYSELAYPLYPGLGNHDYSNNVDDCGYKAIYLNRDKNRCAKEAVWYMANVIDHMIPSPVNKDLPGYVAVHNRGGYVARFTVRYDFGGRKVSKRTGRFAFNHTKAILVPAGATNISAELQEHTGFKWKKIKTYDIPNPVASCYRVSGTTLHPRSRVTTCPNEWPNGAGGSLSYAFDIANYHFVQLQFKPSYARRLPRRGWPGQEDLSPFQFSPSFNVTPSYEWLRADLAAATAAGKYIVINMHSYEGDDEFLDVIRGQNVVAIFAGHIHQDYGQIRMINNGGGLIPFFRSGSAECQTFLLAEFHPTYFNVGVVSTSGGPAFIDTPTVCDNRESLKGTGYATNAATQTLGTYTISVKR